MTLPSRAVIRCKSYAVRWLFEPFGNLDIPERSVLLGQMFGSPLAVIMGSVCALAVTGIGALRSGSSIYVIFGLSEILILAFRVTDWSLRSKIYKLDSDITFEIDKPALLSVSWCALQGALAFNIMASGDLVLSVLSATLTMAMIGPICARNYAAPRFAFLLIILCDVPFVAGVLVSREIWLFIILLLTPPFLAGAMQIIITFHKSMLLTLSAQAKALYLAEHDSLTGILNRQGMERALNQIALHQYDHVALICVDLDGFKQVNDRYGHGAGDILLKQVADRLCKHFTGNDLIARIGGDEFIGVLWEVEPYKVGPLADDLILEISQCSYDIGEDVFVSVGASIGFACFPNDATCISDLRSRADQAMYVAKGAGKGIGRRYSPSF